jgi:hypothetical protein
MEAICSSETSVGTQLTTGRYIPEDGTLQFLWYLLPRIKEIRVILAVESKKLWEDIMTPSVLQTF